jgi:hypothetical protein
MTPERKALIVQCAARIVVQSARSDANPIALLFHVSTEFPMLSMGEVAFAFAVAAVAARQVEPPEDRSL